jgi:hypothetical protein
MIGTNFVYTYLLFLNLDLCEIKQKREINANQDCSLFGFVFFCIFKILFMYTFLIFIYMHKIMLAKKKNSLFYVSMTPCLESKADKPVHKSIKYNRHRR